MAWLLPELISITASAAVLAVTFFLLYREERERYIFLWGLGWAFSFLRYLAATTFIQVPSQEFVVFLTQGLALTSGYFLLWGTLRFLERKVDRIWPTFLGIGFAWLIAGILFDLPFTLLSLPIFYFLGVIYIWTGVIVLRCVKISGAGQWLAGLAFILWGLHKFDYPFLRHHPDLAPWGFLLGAFFEIVLAVGIMLAYIRKSRRSLAEREKSYRFLMENARDIIFRITFDPDYRYDYVSPAAETVLGYTPEEFYGDPTLRDRVVHPDDQETIRLIMKGKQRPEDVNLFRAVHRDGHSVWLEVTLTHHYRDDGHIEAIEGIMRDVTQRRMIEDQLRHSQKMEAIGLLAGGIAHDFNNLLTAISGHADLALLGLDKNHPAVRDLDEINSAAQHASELTRQLLAYGRKQTMRAQAVNLNEILRGLESMLRRLVGENIEMVMEYSPDLWMGRADPTQVEQVVVNLVVNARDAMPEGGTLTLRTNNSRLTPEHSHNESEGGKREYAMISVSDTGCGISAENLNMIFDPFFTTKEVGKGTGLGLSTVYGIVKQSHGQLRVASQIGKGSDFRVYFPRAEKADAGPARSPVAGTRVAGGNERILLVEDNAGVRQMAQRILTQQGYRITMAENGNEAIEYFKTSPDDFDLVIADVVMPEMGGVELVTRLMEIRSDVRTLFISGYTAQKIQNPKVSSIPLLPKPFRAEDLSRAVREIIEAMPVA